VSLRAKRTPGSSPEKINSLPGTRYRSLLPSSRPPNQMAGSSGTLLSGVKAGKVWSRRFPVLGIAAWRSASSCRLFGNEQMPARRGFNNTGRASLRAESVQSPPSPTEEFRSNSANCRQNGRCTPNWG
jgi:hypothetical protein